MVETYPRLRRGTSGVATIRDSISFKTQLQATSFDPDGLALGKSDRFIEGIDEKHVAVTAIPSFTKTWRTEIKIGTDLLQHGA